jgi:chromosomal replication initiation ATPase DnaA|tara:strand:+ start:2598 stop:2960 length:363 start_codon:yes stop_codon:yes gene_type:complete
MDIDNSLTAEEINKLRSLLAFYDHQLPFFNIKIKRYSLHQLSKYVCAYYQISLNELISHRRDRHLVNARRDLVYLATLFTPLSQNQMAKFLHRDHTAIIHYLRQPPVHAHTIKELCGLNE